MKQAAAMAREATVAEHVPYGIHVARSVVRTMCGDYVQTFRLAGASFECSDDESLNAWHERLNVTWRNLAGPNVALWTHVIRRREAIEVDRGSGGGFADQLATRYQQKLTGETLMVNELYVTVVYRPVTGAATGLVAKWLFRRTTDRASTDLVDALDACEKISQVLCASLSRYEPERLGVYTRAMRGHSRLLEFLALLVNGEWRAVPLPSAPINEVLATTRMIVGSEVIEYRLPSQTRLGAMLGIKEYPSPSTVGMINALLSAPFAFVLTQSFAFLTKTTAQGLLQRQRARMANAGDFAVSQAEELGDALDALTSNEFVMGDHHLSLQVLADIAPWRSGEDDAARLIHLNDAVAEARALLADTGMTVAREDLALEAAFWAQLPGNFAFRPRKAPITCPNYDSI